MISRRRGRHLSQGPLWEGSSFQLITRWPRAAHTTSDASSSPSAASLTSCSATGDPDVLWGPVDPSPLLISRRPPGHSSSDVTLRRRYESYEGIISGTKPLRGGTMGRKKDVEKATDAWHDGLSRELSPETRSKCEPDRRAGRRRPKVPWSRKTAPCQDGVPGNDGVSRSPSIPHRESLSWQPIGRRRQSSIAAGRRISRRIYHAQLTPMRADFPACERLCIPDTKQEEAIIHY